MRLVSYSRNICNYDGVSNSVKYFNNFFSKFYDTDLVAIEWDQDKVINFDSYAKKHINSNILFYHFSIYDLNLKKILDLKFKYKILYFHGITPPELFIDEFTKEQCKNGIEQIKLLKNFDLYLFNSPTSKSQFLNNLGVDFKKKSFVIPPVDINNRYKEKPHLKLEKEISKKYKAYYVGTLSDHKKIDNLIKFFKLNFQKFNLNIFTSDKIKLEKDSLNIHLDPIEKIYLQYLGRVPDLKGYETYTRKIKDGCSLEEIVKIFEISPEYKLLENDPISNLYLKYLRRRPDPEGYKIYSQKLDEGVFISEIEEIILESDEYKSLNLDPIEKLYLKYLRRRPDPKGYKIYSKKLDEGFSIKEIEEIILESEEYKALNLDPIEKLYLKYLRRKPDTEGYKIHSKNLDEGLSIKEIEEIILESEEYKSLNEDPIEKIYLKIFGRIPDKEGYDIYTQKLKEGFCIEDIVEILKDSEEYKLLARDPIINLYLNNLDRVPDKEGYRIYSKKLDEGFSIKEIEEIIKSSKEYKLLTMEKQVRINLFHKLNDEYLIEKIKDLDFFISFSQHEGFCIPFFEAIFLNKPPLVKKLEAFQYYLPKYFSYLPNNPTSKDIEVSFNINLNNLNKIRKYIFYRMNYLNKKFYDYLKKLEIIT